MQKKPTKFEIQLIVIHGKIWQLNKNRNNSSKNDASSMIQIINFIIYNATAFILFTMN